MNITNGIITAFINTFYKNDNKDLQELRAFAEAQHVPIILRDTEGLLMNLLRIKKPQRILEIGAAVGYSACCFAEGCGCQVVTIESNPETFEIAKNNIENMGFSDRVEVRSGDARDVLVQMAEEEAAKDDPEGGFDVVFIDAAKSHYKAFWDLALPLCNDDAMIICDNVLMNRGGLRCRRSLLRRRNVQPAGGRRKPFHRGNRRGRDVCSQQGCSLSHGYEYLRS